MNDQSPRDTDAVHVPRWAFRLAGGTMLMATVAFFMTAILCILWLALLTWGMANFAHQYVKDRKAIREEIEEIRRSTRSVERAVVPE